MIIRTLILAMLAPCGFCRAAIPASQPTKTHDVSRLGFTIDSVSPWERLKEGEQDDSVAFLRPDTDGPEAAPSTLFIFIDSDSGQRKDREGELEEVAARVHQAMAKAMPALTLGPIEHSTLSSAQACRWTCAGRITPKEKTFNVKGVVVFCIRSGLVYRLQFITDAGRYDAELLEAEAMLKSLKFVDKRPPATRASQPKG